MTSIKPPGAPGASPLGPSTQGTPIDATNKTAATQGSRFDERVSHASSAKGSAPTHEAQRGQSTVRAGETDATRAVLEQLRSGSISADQAVSKLTDLAVQRAATPAMRPVIEARLRSWMQSDPTVRALLKQMGASVAPPSDPSEQ